MTQAARQDPARASAPLPLPGTVPGWAVVSAALSPVLLVSAWLVADALQPASYSPLRQSVSVMVIGGCHLVTAAGLTALRMPARILLVIAGASSIGIALCPEPAVGSTPAHLAFTALGAATIAIWPAFTVTRTAARPAILSPIGAAVVTVVFLILLSWLAAETQGGSDLGLAERLSSSAETFWPLIVALSLRSALRRAGAGRGEPEPEVLMEDQMTSWRGQELSPDRTTF
jgi:Protein of unknown function (DUF998)